MSRPKPRTDWRWTLAEMRQIARELSEGGNTGEGSS